MGISFRHSAGFGKRMEYNLVGKMLMEGLDVYLPLVDDHGVDCVIKKDEGTFIEVQIKARSNEVTDGDAALFSAITHDLTDNFYFEDMISKGSIKLRIMAEIVRDMIHEGVNPNKEWKESAYEEHGNEMLEILRNACGL